MSSGSSLITAPHFLPKRIRSKGPSLHPVSGTSKVLFPSPTPARTSTRSAVVSRYLTYGTGLPRCIKHFPDMPSSLPRWIRTGASIGCFPVLLRPSPNIGRVGFHIFTFEACSRFTRVTACRFAATLMVYFCLQSFSRQVSLSVCLDSYRVEPIITRTELSSVSALYPRGAPIYCGVFFSPKVQTSSVKRNTTSTQAIQYFIKKSTIMCQIEFKLHFDCCHIQSQLLT